MRAYFKIQFNNKTPFSFTLFVQKVTIFVIRKPGMQEGKKSLGEGEDAGLVEGGWVKAKDLKINDMTRLN